jgi:hypothetical protein
MMNRVYTTANQVLIWLGEARGDSDFAMTSLKELAGGQRATAAEILRLRGLFHYCLMDRDWWGCLWIVQEVVLAKSDPIIICGHSYISWNTFQKAIDMGSLGFYYVGILGPRKDWSAAISEFRYTFYGRSTRTRRFRMNLLSACMVSSFLPKHSNQLTLETRFMAAWDY